MGRLEKPMAGRQAGFTLLEMLIVVILLGLLMIGLTQGVRAGLALWSAQQRRVAETAELDAAARALRHLLTDVPGVAAPNVGGSEPSAGFKGGADQLSFVGDLPTGFGTTQRADITLLLHGSELVLSWLPRRHEISLAPPPKPTTTELIGGVARLDIAYWSAASADRAAGWVARWDGPAPPTLLRIRLAFAKGDRRHWPDLIVAPVL